MEILNKIFGKKQFSDLNIFDRLYPYQKDAVSKAISNDKGIICLPTGCGKTYIQAAIVADDIIKNGNFQMYVVNAPRIILTYQLLKEIYSFLVVYYGFIKKYCKSHILDTFSVYNEPQLK